MDAAWLMLGSEFFSHLQGLGCNLLLLVRRHAAQGPHVVQPICQLHYDNPHLPRRREDCGDLSFRYSPISDLSLPIYSLSGTRMR